MTWDGPDPDDPALASSLRYWACTTPDAPCLTCAGTTRRWREVHEQASRLGQALLAAGIGREGRVAPLGGNRSEFFEVMMGASTARAVPFAVDTRLSRAETLAVLADSAAQVDRLAAHEARDPRVPVGADDTALQICTSGTTGLPTAAMLGNAALMASTRINHVLFGAHTVVERQVVADRLLESIARYRVTLIGIVPSVVRMLVESPAVATLDVSSLRTISYAASPIPPDLLRRAVELFGCRFVQVYGMTETNRGTVPHPEDPVDPDRPELLASAGRPLPYASVRVVDPDTGTDVPEGRVGEVWIRTPSQLSGYWRRSEGTAAILIADGHVRTGDGGFFERGYLFLQDRIKFLQDRIKDMIITHPGIHDVAVVGVPSQR